MQIPVLLVATATRWLGVARMPRNLAKAGFEVSLLIPDVCAALHAAINELPSPTRAQLDDGEELCAHTSPENGFATRTVTGCENAR